MENVRTLVSMNFPRGAAVEALKQVNNSVGRALDVRFVFFFNSKICF
jgi:hypothetical protein